MKLMSRWLCVLSFTFLAASYVYELYLEYSTAQYRSKVLSANTRRKIAVGFGGCRDAYTNGIEFLKETDLKPTLNESLHETIETKSQLEATFNYVLRRGLTLERYVANDKLFRAIKEDVMYMSSRNVQWRMGGSAPVIAKRFVDDGFTDVYLATRLHYRHEKIFDNRIRVPGLTTRNDDTHLVLEFAKGAKWGDIVAPRSSRLVLHRDDSNPKLDTLERFMLEIRTYEPDLIVIAGLQAMEFYPFKAGELEMRLMQLETMFRTSVLPHTRVHFEMSHFTHEAIIREFLFHVIRYSDSIGLNEHELCNLRSILNEGRLCRETDRNPRIADALDQMRRVYDTLKTTPRVSGKRPLTRLHVHTIAYQLILVAKEAHVEWRNTREAVAHASLTANLHVCQHDKVNTSATDILLDNSFSLSNSPGHSHIFYNSSSAVTCWEEKAEGGDLVEICLAPTLVCNSVRWTEGAADNISASALAVQI